jgi:hypothetical protein
MVISEKMDEEQCEPLYEEAGMLYVCTCQLLLC